MAQEQEAQCPRCPPKPLPKPGEVMAIYSLYSHLCLDCMRPCAAKCTAQGKREVLMCQPLSLDRNLLTRPAYQHRPFYQHTCVATCRF